MSDSLYHVYLVRQQGAALLRQATYHSQKWGERPAAWAARRTAYYWGKRIASEKGGLFRVLLCEMDNCPVCEIHRKEFR